MLADRIPDIMETFPPASAEQIDALATALSLVLPDEYRALLAEADGVSASLVQIFPTEEVREMTSANDGMAYCPGFILIGTVSDSPLLLRSGATSAVYRND